MTWTVSLNEPPAAPLLNVGDLFLVATQKTEQHTECTKLYTYSLASGDPRWLRSFENTRVSGLASIPKSGISITSILLALDVVDQQHNEGMLLALDIAGNVQWQREIGTQRISAPVATDDIVCVTAGAEIFFVIDVNSGEVRAKTKLEINASFSAPTLTNRVAYIPCRGPNLMAVGLDGQPQWCFDMPGSPGNVWLNQSPFVVGKRIITTASNGSVLTLRVQDGALLWRTELTPPSKRPSPPAADDERVYIGASNGLYAFNIADGRQLWVFPTERSIQATPIIVADVVYVACHDHHIYALDAVNGKKLWQHEVGQRRIEIPPIVTTVEASCEARIFVADRGGYLAAITRPLSAVEHQEAGNWLEAASAFAELGQVARSAELLETHNEPLKAAELWAVAGEPKHAAIQYEQAEEWQRAAKLWEELDQPLKAAEALEHYARSLDETVCDPQEQATAWSTAANAFEAEGEKDRALVCQREVAKYLQKPFITVEVQHERLVANAWTHIQFIAKNEGRGTAHNLIIRVEGEQFEGQAASTREIPSLKPGRQKSEWLDIRPRQYGGSVPMRVAIAYKDNTDNTCICERVVYLTVAKSDFDEHIGSHQSTRSNKAGSTEESYVHGIGENTLTNPSAFTSGYALLIGVGGDLPATVQDAIALRDILIDPQRCAYPADQVKLLTESQATRHGILNGLDWLITQAKNTPNTTAVVYFSGHGGQMPNYHLVPNGYDPRVLSDTAITGIEFTEKLRAIEAKKLLILLDCCHAGGIAEVKSIDFVKSPIPPELNSILTLGSGRVLIASSRKNELSYAGTHYSVFTQALREGLAGYGASEWNGYSYVADIAMHVGRVVPNRTNDRQHPILKLAAADNFAIAYYAGGEKSPQPLTGTNSHIPPVEVNDVDIAVRYRRILRKYQNNLLDVEERIAQFYDQAAVPLDLERTREGIVQRIAEIENKIEQAAKASGWTPPSVAPTARTLEDVMHRLNEMHLDLGSKL